MIWVRGPRKIALNKRVSTIKSFLTKTKMSKRKQPDSNGAPMAEMRVKRQARKVVRRQQFKSGITDAQIVQMSKQLGEKKGVDIGIAHTGVVSTTNTNANIDVLNLVQAGTGSWNRVGRKIHLKSVRVRGLITAAFRPAATTEDLIGQTLRMILVWDKQPSGAAIPTFDTIFGTTTQAGVEATTLLDPVKYDNMGRFQVLRDKVWDFNPPTHVSGGTEDDYNMVFNFDEFVKLGNRETVFSGQSNPMTIADISTGALYLIFRSSANIANQAIINVNAGSFSRLRYVD